LEDTNIRLRGNRAGWEYVEQWKTWEGYGDAPLAKGDMVEGREGEWNGGEENYTHCYDIPWLRAKPFEETIGGGGGSAGF